MDQAPAVAAPARKRSAPGVPRGSRSPDHVASATTCAQRDYFVVVSGAVVRTAGSPVAGTGAVGAALPLGEGTDDAAPAGAAPWASTGDAGAVAAGGIVGAAAAAGVPGVSVAGAGTAGGGATGLGEVGAAGAGGAAGVGAAGAPPSAGGRLGTTIPGASGMSSTARTSFT
jgi:hypothetical protein